MIDRGERVYHPSQPDSTASFAFLTSYLIVLKRFLRKYERLTRIIKHAGPIKLQIKLFSVLSQHLLKAKEEMFCIFIIVNTSCKMSLYMNGINVVLLKITIVLMNIMTLDIKMSVSCLRLYTYAEFVP